MHRLYDMAWLLINAVFALRHLGHDSFRNRCDKSLFDVNSGLIRTNNTRKFNEISLKFYVYCFYVMFHNFPNHIKQSFFFNNECRIDRYDCIQFWSNWHINCALNWSLDIWQVCGKVINFNLLSNFVGHFYMYDLSWIVLHHKYVFYLSCLNTF